MSALSLSNIWNELKNSKGGITGLSILAILLIASLIAFVSIPLDTFKEWRNQSYWLEYPRAAMPSWVNVFTSNKLPEHVILKGERGERIDENIKIVTYTYRFNYIFDKEPNDFMLKYDAIYNSSSLLHFSITRPDGMEIELARITLPPAKERVTGILFSTDDVIRKSISKYGSNEPLDVIFRDKDGDILKGVYEARMSIFFFNMSDEIIDSKFIVGGKVYGLFGTDELRRDLAISIIWGAPVALFIGISVAILAVVIGLIYGVIAGYSSRSIDEVMMRTNDIVYALPALPLLILLAVFIGKSIFLMIGYLVIFSWVGVAKVARSMSLQIRNMPYIEAAELIGESKIRIIFKHIIPQLLPYTFASIAISVPGAIITEAGLSFLGLGDPTLPTWGQILHDANIYGASARGLWWWIIPPGLMITLTGLAFVLIGDTLNTIVNPRLKR